MEYTEKVVHQSNHWYNDGLSKAKIHDLSGAVTSLRKSLQLNSENIAARNLLGLVYYGRGEVGEALVEWILSKNLQPEDNVANYYIKKIQKNPEELAAINDAIRKYNDSLIYCEQGGEDLAIIQLKKAIETAPNFLRAYQLMALLYLHNEQLAKAREVLKEARKIDTTNDITLQYIHELTELRKRNRLHFPREGKEHAITYQVGNDVIIQPTSAMGKDAHKFVISNVIVGAVVAILVMWFLVFPMMNKTTVDRTNRQVTEFSNRLAEEEAQISALKKELDIYRANEEETEEAKKTGTSTKSSYEIIIEMYGHFQDGDLSDSQMVEQLLQVNKSSLGEIGLSRYEEMTSKVYERYGETLFYEALTQYVKENYSGAIETLGNLTSFYEGYGEGKAMFLYARAYEASGDSENAAKWDEKLKKEYPDFDMSYDLQGAYDYYYGYDSYDYDYDNYDNYDYDNYDYYDYDYNDYYYNY